MALSDVFNCQTYPLVQHFGQRADVSTPALVPIHGVNNGGRNGGDLVGSDAGEFNV